MTFTDSLTEALIVATGILLVAGLLATLIYQAFGPWRARVSVQRERAYTELAAQTADTQESIRDRLSALGEDVAGIRSTADELERLIKTVA